MKKKFDYIVPKAMAKVEVHTDCKVDITSTMAGYHWIMHNHDADINDPSCPHCHATDAKKTTKLDIYTGYYYEYPGRKYAGKISKQDMKRMWSQTDFLLVVMAERKWYLEEYHAKNPIRYPALPNMPIAIKHSKAVVRVTSKWIKTNQNREFLRSPR